jgi:hypothetical protein
VFLVFLLGMIGLIIASETIHPVSWVFVVPLFALAAVPIRCPRCRHPVLKRRVGGFTFWSSWPPRACAQCGLPTSSPWPSN